MSLLLQMFSEHYFSFFHSNYSHLSKSHEAFQVAAPLTLTERKKTLRTHSVYNLSFDWFVFVGLCYRHLIIWQLRFMNWLQCRSGVSNDWLIRLFQNFPRSSSRTEGSIRASCLHIARPLLSVPFNSSLCLFILITFYKCYRTRRSKWIDLENFQLFKDVHVSTWHILLVPF